MGELTEEVKIWNTPVVGAYLLWRFTVGYCDGHPDGDAPIGLLHFVAIAILSNKELSRRISNKRSGLESYVSSFDDDKNVDLLLSIHRRTKEKLQYALQSIDIATTYGLLAWDVETGKLYPREISSKPGRGKAPKEEYKREGNKAEILGKWFSGNDLPKIANYLKVVF